MKQISLPIIAIILLLLLSNSIAAQPPIGLSNFVKKESLKHASIGFKTVDLQTGKTIASHNSNVSLTPGSTMKLVTTATALEVLGGNYSYETEFVYDGYIQDGILWGNLFVLGSGDPTLGSEFISPNNQDFIDRLYDGLQQLDIKSIEGDIIAMDKLFGYNGVSQKWLWEDLGNAYAPGIYGISIYDNTCKIELQSGKAGENTTIIGMQPNIPQLEFVNNIKADASSADNSYVSGAPFSYQRHLYGTIPQNRGSFFAKSDIPDPGVFLAQEIKSHLGKKGISINGEAFSYRTNPTNPTSPIRIIKINSPELKSIVRVVNVRSNNHYAEHIYKLLTQIKGIDIAAYWKRKGLDSSALFMYDGSGISPVNSVSTDFLVDILSYMNPNGDFFRSLPIAGKEGTVASFLKNTELSGKGRLKSGSISNVQSYAGYIEKDNKRYAFAIIINNYTGKRAELRKAIEQLLVSIF